MPASPTRQGTTDGSDPTHRALVAAAALALVAELAVPGLVRQVPLGPLWVTVLLLAGITSLFLLWFGRSGRAYSDRLLVALTPFLAAGVLARLLYMDPGTSQTVVLREAALPETIALATGLGLARLLGPSDRGPGGAGLVHVGAIGTLAAVGLLGVHVAQAWPIQPGASIVLGLTVVLVAACLLVQRTLAQGRDRARLAVLATGPGLAVAGGQLLDGIVSYLAVVDPLNLLAGSASEGVILSRALLSLGGPVFPLVKWGVAAGAVALVEPDADEAGDASAWRTRFLLLVLILFAGLGPGLFSSLQVLSG